MCLSAFRSTWLSVVWHSEVSFGLQPLVDAQRWRGGKRSGIWHQEVIILRFVFDDHHCVVVRHLRRGH